MNTLTHSRISIFLPALEGGGAERAMLHLAEGLAERGLTVDLVLAETKGAYLNDVPDHIRVVDLEARSPVLLTKTLALRRYLREEQPAVLFSALDIFSSAIWAQRMAGVQTRIIMCVQTYLSRQFRNHQRQTIGRLRPLVVRWFYPMADAIVAASQGTADDVARITGLPGEAIEVIYNPVVTPEMLAKLQQPIDHPWFAEGEPPVILGVGRLVSQKDFVNLIHAFAQVRRQRPARLLILGEGEDRPLLKALIQELGLATDVALPGFVENPYAYMAHASVFALSSEFEGFGNVVAEALAAGVPVVSTNCKSGPSEILENGKYGALVPIQNPDALAQAILTTLDQPRRSEQLQRRSQSFSMQVITEQYLNVIHHVCDPGGLRIQADHP